MWKNMLTLKNEDTNVNISEHFNFNYYWYKMWTKHFIKDIKLKKGEISMSRSSKKVPYVAPELMKRIEAMNESGKKEVL